MKSRLYVTCVGRSGTRAVEGCDEMEASGDACASTSVSET